MLDRAPPCTRHATLSQRKRGADIRDGIDKIAGQFVPTRLPLAGLAPIGVDRSVDQVIGPGDDVSLLVDSAAHAANTSGTIEVVRHIVFAGPHKLNRRGDVAGNLRSFGLEIVLVTPPKPSTHEGCMNGNGGFG